MAVGNSDRSMSKDSFADGAPSSDSDPYDDLSSPRKYSVDGSNFPKPIPVLGPLFGFSDKRFQDNFQQRMQHFADTLKRQPTQDEATAFAYYIAKHGTITSYGPPLGVAGGIWRWYSTMDTFRFPFWRPNLEKLQPEVFPYKLPILKGTRAIAAWHILRALAYGTVGMWIGSMFFGSYSTSVVLLGEMSDPRLRAYWDTLKDMAKKKQGALVGTGQQSQQSQTGSQARQNGTPPGADKTGQDDASPTGGIWGQPDMRPSGTYDTTGQPRRPTFQLPPQRPIPPRAPTTSSQDNSFDMFDDASPTGGQGMMDDETPARPQGSAWERLRRGEKPVSNPSKTTSRPSQGPQSQQQIENQWEQRQGSTLGDGYTFSKTDEERSYAKEEAQKEFDARIERERRGGDFDSGNKKW
ncbi:hypothetical protein EG329_007595 [Mollisiaceae sp. DMI_Dod_QoI]|nr:hypothetical protein EG329_007595 [Helotiales sp. DMI_Dod_QoI]